MNRRTAMLLSGAITAFALMLVIGLVYGANRFNSAAGAAAPAVTGATADGSSAQANSAEVAALQQQVQTLKTQLQQSYSDLQNAYNQITALQGQNTGGGRLRNGRGSLNQNPLGGQQQTPLFGGDD